MSYSGFAKAALLSIGLSACAHGSQQSASSSPATYAEANAPRFQSVRSTFLAGESRPHEVAAGGAVVAEGVGCDAWSREQEQRCNLSQLTTESVAGGIRNNR